MSGRGLKGTTQGKSGPVRTIVRNGRVVDQKRYNKIYPAWPVWRKPTILASTERLIIAGSRSFWCETHRETGYFQDACPSCERHYGLLCRVIAESGFNPDVVLSGCALGPDRLAFVWADRQRRPIFAYPADWKRNGNAAGPIRNERMAKDGTALLALWDGHSRGTADMIEKATKRGLTIHIFRTDPSRQPTRAESPVTAGWQRQGGRTPGEGHASSDLSQSPARTERSITRGEPTREDACFDRGPQKDQGRLSESRAPA